MRLTGISLYPTDNCFMLLSMRCIAESVASLVADHDQANSESHCALHRHFSSQSCPAGECNQQLQATISRGGPWPERSEKDDYLDNVASKFERHLTCVHDTGLSCR